MNKDQHELSPADKEKKDDEEHRLKYLASLGNLAHRYPIKQDLWNKMEVLPVEGAALYSYGLDPDTIRQELEHCGYEDNSLDQLPSGFNERMRIITSAVIAGSIKRTPTNGDNSSGCGNHTEIEKQSFLTWYGKHRDSWDIAEAIPTYPRYQTKALTPKPMKLEPQGAENIGTKERETLLKIIFGMAISRYGYKPTDSRSEVTGEKKGSIHFDLDQLGIHVDVDTIRKYLKEAKPLVPAKDS